MCFFFKHLMVLLVAFITMLHCSGTSSTIIAFQSSWGFIASFAFIVSYTKFDDKYKYSQKNRKCFSILLLNIVVCVSVICIYIS